jgi:hypothetical protein
VVVVAFVSMYVVVGTSSPTSSGGSYGMLSVVGTNLPGGRGTTLFGSPVAAPA